MAHEFQAPAPAYISLCVSGVTGKTRIRYSPLPLDLVAAGSQRMRSIMPEAAVLASGGEQLLVARVNGYQTLNIKAPDVHRQFSNTKRRLFPCILTPHLLAFAHFYDNIFRRAYLSTAD